MDFNMYLCGVLKQMCAFRGKTGSDHTSVTQTDIYCTRVNDISSPWLESADLC